MPPAPPRRDFLNYRTIGKVAILIDGGFFLKRIAQKCRPEERNNVDHVIKLINILCAQHAQKLNQQIYRIFFYDCLPSICLMRLRITNHGTIRAGSVRTLNHAQTSGSPRWIWITGL